MFRKRNIYSVNITLSDSLLWNYSVRYIHILVVFLYGYHRKALKAAMHEWRRAILFFSVDK